MLSKEHTTGNGKPERRQTILMVEKIRNEQKEKKIEELCSIMLGLLKRKNSRTKFLY